MPLFPDNYQAAFAVPSLHGVAKTFIKTGQGFYYIVVTPWRFGGTRMEKLSDDNNNHDQAAIRSNGLAPPERQAPICTNIHFISTKSHSQNEIMAVLFYDC
jgi:hypothetical protein